MKKKCIKPLAILVVAFLMNFVVVNSIYSIPLLDTLVNQQRKTTKKHYYSLISDLFNLTNKDDSLDFIFIDNAFSERDTINVEIGTVDKAIRFDNCKFTNKFAMKAVEYNSKLEVSHCNFNSIADFSHSYFKDSIFFDLVDFSQSPNLAFCRLPKFISFKETTIHSDSKIDFSTCYLADNKKKCVVKFIGTQSCSNMIIPYDLFEIDTFQQADYSVAHDDRIRTYESLIKNCKEAGLLESVQKWDIDYRKYVNKTKYGIAGIAFNWLNECWWNFGYNQAKILWFWTPVFFLLFCAINRVALLKLQNVYFDEDIGKSFKISKDSPKAILGKHKFIYSIIYTAAIFFNFRLTLSAMNLKNHLGMAYIFLIYVIGTIHVVFGLGYILNGN